jgi:tetratricopeptide (TPR) repeat protein
VFTLKKYIAFIFVVILALVNGCGKGSAPSPEERAQDLTRRAVELRENMHYLQAERALAEAIEIYSSLEREQPLIESYSALSDLQMHAGKLSSAVQSLTTLRRLYAGAGDRRSEIRTMIEIGKIERIRGNGDAALGLLQESDRGAQLFQFTKEQALARLFIGLTLAGMNKHHNASTYFSQASVQCLSQNDITGALTAIAGHIRSLLTIGEEDEAYRFLQQYENIIATNNPTVNVSDAYAQCGFSFLYAGRWEIAKACFDRAAVSTFFPSEDGMARINPQLGIGEVLFNNFAFDDAQRRYITAYTTARSHSHLIAQAFLMVRIADCELKKSTAPLSQERSIRAQQFYEHAQNLFARAGVAVGDAIVMHRLGTVKEAMNDNNGALAYYKRAFEKFADIPSVRIAPDAQVDLMMLMKSTDRPSDPYRWFSDRMIALMTKHKKYSDAVTAIERTRSLRLRATVVENISGFRDRAKDSIFAQWKREILALTTVSSELSRFDKNTDPDHYSRLQRAAAASKLSAASLSHAMSVRFPELAPLNPAPLDQVPIAPSATVLRYCSIDNEYWVFVLQEGKEIDAVRLSQYGIILNGKMNRYLDLLARGTPQSTEMNALSEELYSLLVQPVEQFGKQRFVIIPSDGIEKFPFHVLTKNGKPLFDMIEVSYLPSISSLNARRPLPAMITSVTAFGFSSDSRWGLDFELRDIRSFFVNAKIYLNQGATLQRLEQVSGEVLQISTRFVSTPDGDHSFILSDGTSSLLGMVVPVSHIAAVHPFPIVVLNDVRSTGNSITGFHSLLWLINGTSAVITNEFPLTPRSSKIFVENFYSVYASTFEPYTAYRKALGALEKSKAAGERMMTASYFYYGR